MSNDKPPRACLADFGFMTMVLDPNKPMSSSAQLEGGTMTFMSPELLVPSLFNVKNAVPTTESDIYAFGLVIFQVCAEHHVCLTLAYAVQVLTGEIPFRGIRTSELGFLVPQGRRPEKPKDALLIGFSDPLWGFAQSCWDHKKDLRPKVSEVVTQLAKEAASWRGVMLPSGQAENVASASKASTLGSLENCTFRNLICPLVLLIE